MHRTAYSTAQIYVNCADSFYTQIRVLVYAHTHIAIRTYAYVCTHIRVYLCAHTRIVIRTYAYMYTRIYTYSCFDKGCPAKALKRTRQCRMVLWVERVWR